MDVSDVICGIKASGRITLTEAESKAVLARYGVPVVEEWVVGTDREAVDCAETVGYPVVLKGLGARLTHKTERGLVKLNLQNAEAVYAAAGEIAAGAGADLEGFLLQPLVSGRREFVAGLFRDAQFGPVVMFGLGGIFTEALDDVVFRIAPLDEAEARHMIGELRAKKLLAAFRGEEPAHAEELIRVLVGLSRLGCEHPEIREVDINPLIITPDGRVKAVDALVVLEEKTAETSPYLPPVAPEDVIAAFTPRSVALIGVSENIRKWGFRIFTGIGAGGYEGKLHLVNPKGGEILGRIVYPSLTDVPGPVDLAVVTVPAEGVMELLPAMQAKGVKNMLLISSGFGETGPEGRRLERDLVAAARKAGVLILGPNTMGFINPYARFYSIGAHARPMPGSIAFISQSGNMGGQLLAFAEQEGMGIRCFVGSGNEAMVTVEDYLEGCAADELTKMIVLYIESVKNGRRFFEAARRVGRHKPVIILKGGRTAEGDKAAASHTGGMASNKRVFEAACRQAGAILVEQPTELFNVTACLSSLPLPRGKRVGIMSMGGGWGVVATDLCVEHGLEIPHLSQEIIARIDRILPPYWSRSNPVDLVGDADPAVPLKVMEELMRWDGCDACIHLGSMGRMLLLRKIYESALLTDPGKDWSIFEDFLLAVRKNEREYMEKVIRLTEKYNKPILGAYMRYSEESRIILDLVPGSFFKGVVFRTPEHVIQSMSKMCSYSRWLDRERKAQHSNFITRKGFTDDNHRTAKI